MATIASLGSKPWEQLIASDLVAPVSAFIKPGEDKGEKTKPKDTKEKKDKQDKATDKEPKDKKEKEAKAKGED